MRINVRVVARSKKVRIQPFNNGLKVHLVEPAVEGKANKALIAALAAYYKVKKSALAIVKGAHQKDKVISIDETA